MSPTARTLKWLREEGYLAQVVERYNSFSRKRVDLWGCIDILAIRKLTNGVFGIQATSTSNVSARLTKSKGCPELRVWLEAGNRFEVVGWSKKGPRGKRKLWTMVRQEITLEDLE